MLESRLPLPLVARGKVRDVYGLTGEGMDRYLLFLATDRISAFDCILPDGIPGKGRVLTQMSVFWFRKLANWMPSHFVSAETKEYPPELRPFQGVLEGRSMLVRRAEMIGVECVARGYLTGSGWKEYCATQSVCGVPLPRGLRDGDRLPEPIFTPAMKAYEGHDENVPFERVAQQVGAPLAEQLRLLTLRIYMDASEYARGRGIILADTKFEFGFIDGRLCLADEVLTPDSSRWWPADDYRPGAPQPSYDKQFVRNYLESVHWNKQPPPPTLPLEVIEKTSAKYQEALERLTG